MPRSKARPAKTRRDHIRVTGAGFHFPDQKLTTFDLIKKERPGFLVPDKVRQSIGCHEIRVAGPDDTPSTMAAQAAGWAMRDAAVSAEDIDLLVTVICTPPDYDMWSMPAKVAQRIGARRAECFGIGDAGCAGAFAAMRGVLPMMQVPGGPKRAMIAASCITPGNHYFAPTTIFGDGAGAMILERVRGEQPDDAPSLRPSVVRADLYSHPDMVDAFGTESGLNRLRIDGRVERSHYNFIVRDDEVFARLRSTNFDLGAAALKSSLDKAGWLIDSLTWLVPDNVSDKIGYAIASRLGVEDSRVLVENCYRFGHAFVVDLFLNLATVFALHPLRRGDRLACVGMGLGQHWGVALLEVP